MNKLYFMSATEMIEKKIEGKPSTYDVSWASEIVIARDDEWAKKVAFDQNGTFPLEKWKIDAVYSLDDLKVMLELKDHAIIGLGASY